MVWQGIYAPLGSLGLSAASASALVLAMLAARAIFTVSQPVPAQRSPLERRHTEA